MNALEIARKLEHESYFVGSDVETQRHASKMLRKQAEELAHYKNIFVPYQEIRLVGEHSEEYERGFWDVVDYLKKVQTGEIKHDERIKELDKQLTDEDIEVVAQALFDAITKINNEESLMSHEESKCNINVTERSDLETYMLHKWKILPSGENSPLDGGILATCEPKLTIPYVTEENVSPDEPIAVIYQDPDTNRPALKFTLPFKYKAMSAVNEDIPLYVRADKETISVKDDKPVKQLSDEEIIEIYKKIHGWDVKIGDKNWIGLARAIIKEITK